MDIQSTQNMDLSTQVNILTSETFTLRAQIKHLKAQKEFIIRLLREQNEQLGITTKYNYAKVLPVESRKTFPKRCVQKLPPSSPECVDVELYAFTRYFPIKTQEELQAFEALIDDTNIEDFAKVVKSLVVDGSFKKHIRKIFSELIITSYNIDGVHGKGRLLDYPKTMDVLHKSNIQDGWTFKMFLNDLRVGFRLTKRSFFKKVSKVRARVQKEIENDEIMGESEVEEITMPY